MTVDIEALWHEHHDPMFRYVRRHIDRKETIEDIVQMVFVKAWSAICRGNGYTEHAGGWLFQIARNVIADYYRAQVKMADEIELDACMEDNEEGRTGRAYAEILASHDLSPHELFEQKAVQETVRAAVNGLCEGQAWSITLRLEGFSNEEIAEISGKDVRSIRSINTRAYANLREWLKDAA